MNCNVADAHVLANELAREIARAEPLLKARSDQDADKSRKPGAWTPKQILGHLIDSAFHNHQRFVLASLNGTYCGDGYEQEQWVQLHGYNRLEWAELLRFWVEMNRFIAHTVGQIPAERLDVSCQIGDAAPVALHELIADYIRHLRHHLDQIEESWNAA